MLSAVLRPDAAVYALAVPHLKMRALACPAALLMFVAVGAFRGFKDTTYASPNSREHEHCLSFSWHSLGMICVSHKACVTACFNFTGIVQHKCNLRFQCMLFTGQVCTSQVCSLTTVLDLPSTSGCVLLHLPGERKQWYTVLNLTLSSCKLYYATPVLLQ